MNGARPLDATAPRPPSDDHVAAVALSGLPDMTPVRLAMLLRHFSTWGGVARAVQRGLAGRFLLERSADERRAHLAALLASWPERLDLPATRTRLVARRTHVWLRDEPAYPVADALPELPAVLLAEGARPDALACPRVAVVGTRAATPHGLADAHELAATLAGAGVTVVSGLAIGIDAAAHAGALDGGGPTVGVVATGLDVEYPRRHAVLYRRMRDQGLVLGETGYGIGPAPWRFPIRNRIIAALADVVVVVEATLTGGARITAEHALRYDRAVFAVPGSRRNAAAAGTNALIADGAYPLTDWSDLLLALGMTPGARRARPARVAPDHDGRAVLDALGGDAASPEQLAARTGLPPERVALAVTALERAGWVSWERGVVWAR